MAREHDQGAQSVGEPLDMDLDQVCAEALELLSARIPNRLSSKFRCEVMGPGRSGEFAAALKRAVERCVEWRGEEYGALALWSTDGCKSAWASALEAERDRWRMMVGDMKKVYCMLRSFELGLHVNVTSAEYSSMANGTASFKALRSMARRQRVVHGIDRWCRELSGWL